MYSIYRQCVSEGGEGGGVELCCRPHSAGVLHSVSDEIRNQPNCFTTPNKITSEDNIKGLVSLKFLRPWVVCTSVHILCQTVYDLNIRKTSMNLTPCMNLRIWRVGMDIGHSYCQRYNMMLLMKAVPRRVLHDL